MTNSILLVRADINRDGHDLPIAWLVSLECQGNLFYLHDDLNDVMPMFGEAKKTYNSLTN